MGLTREQWHEKRVNEIINYVIEHGRKLPKNIIYWDTYPVCVKDICVLGVIVEGSKVKKLYFGDISKDNIINKRKSADELERKYLEETLADMKIEDKKYKK